MTQPPGGRLPRSTLTPARAGALLATISTRPGLALSPASREKIDGYVTAMLTGQWLTASPMPCDNAGQLVDGFHRCHAVALSGVAIPVDVTTVPWRLNPGTPPPPRKATRVVQSSFRAGMEQRAGAAVPGAPPSGSPNASGLR